MHSETGSLRARHSQLELQHQNYSSQLRETFQHRPSTLNTFHHGSFWQDPHLRQQLPCPAGECPTPRPCPVLFLTPHQAQAIAELNGLEVEIPSDFQIGVTNKSSDFLDKFPYGKVPAFESADGKFFLTEGQAIARYLAESGPKAGQLIGDDAQTRALVEQWACFADQEIAPNLIPPLLMVILKMIPYDEEKYKFFLTNLERAVRRLEAAVKERKYLVGDQLTLADIMVLGPMQLAAKFLVDVEMRKEAPSVEGYLRGLLEVPELKKAFGELELCETRKTL